MVSSGLLPAGVTGQHTHPIPSRSDNRSTAAAGTEPTSSGTNPSHGNGEHITSHHRGSPPQDGAAIETPGTLRDTRPTNDSVTSQSQSLSLRWKLRGGRSGATAARGKKAGFDFVEDC
jgi:hypothetical protein